ncbi:MAG: hypothetical protein R2737_14915 [Candidatus Nanopelagicales bacterium]
MLAVDVDERDYSWLRVLYNFRPNITMFFRPELYPGHLVRAIPGIRVAILSEPIAAMSAGQLRFTEESRLRHLVYSNMDWLSYHWRVYYDEGRRPEASALGFVIDEFRPLPIDTSVFRPPPPEAARDIDVFFVGKATPHRIETLDFLRLHPGRFLWIAHGVSGSELAALLQRSKVVLNVHADGVPAAEPRVHLAAACGAVVLSERLSAPSGAGWPHVLEVDSITHDAIRLASDAAEKSPKSTAPLNQLSVRSFLAEVMDRFAPGVLGGR